MKVKKIKTPPNTLCVCFSSKVLLTSSRRAMQLQVFYNLLPLPSPTHSLFINPFKSSLLMIHSHWGFSSKLLCILDSRFLMKISWLNENESKLFLLLFSMVDFKGICNFNVLLKIKTKNIVLFLLTSKKN
jgi:hypothetical protein